MEEYSQSASKSRRRDEYATLGTRSPQIGRIVVPEDELNLTHTLTPGQAFRWKRDPHGRWTGVLGKRVIRLWREGAEVAYEVFPGGQGEELIRDYFRLDVNLRELYRIFVGADGRLAKPIERFRGLRVVRQDPEETLLSYVCSAANSVSRITSAIEAMSRRYGELVAEVDGSEYYSFPSAEVLAHVNAEELACLCGLGFRAVNLKCVAEQLTERPAHWLHSLRQATYDEARRKLLTLRCVGMKIADCVLLFSLDKDEAVPVDTHIRQVAVKYYLPEFRQKTLTPAVYQQIVDIFQQKFGKYAGWAQEYLFYDDLLRHKPSQRVL